MTHKVQREKLQPLNEFAKPISVQLPFAKWESIMPEIDCDIIALPFYDKDK